MTPRFNAIGMVAADMAATLRFYRALGLDIPAESDTAPHVDVELPGGVRLMWDTEETIRSFDPDWRRPTGDPQANLAFACETPAAVDKTYAEMTGAGFHGHKAPWDAFFGMRYAILHDPDGNGVDLYAPLD